MRIDRRLLGWGIFLILLGGIPLAVKLGVLVARVVGDWALLWPVLLIGWGLGLLLRGTRLALVGGTVSAVTFGIMGGGALATGFGGVPIASGCTHGEAATAFPAQSGVLGAAARVDIEFTCGTLTGGTTDGSSWTIIGSDRGGVGPTIKAGASDVSIGLLDSDDILHSVARTTWDITLPRSPALSLHLTLNAGTGTFDLAGATVSNLSVTLNAGSLDIALTRAERVGDVGVTVNAGDASIRLPGGDRSIDATINAGALEVCLPSGTAVRVEWTSTLGANNFDANGLVAGGDETWTTGGFIAGQPHVELQVTANAGSFELNFGGTCNA